jgi:tRNA-intron endonuclease
MIQIHSNLTSTSQQAFTLFEKSKFGEKKSGKIIYSIYEALFLIETKKANSKKKIKLNKQQQNNYLVFKDLRKKTYIVKTGLKFGAEFRVYKKSDKHASYLLEINTDKQKITLKEFISKNRVSHSTGKILLLAIIDSQKDITYYNIGWMKP